MNHSLPVTLKERLTSILKRGPETSKEEEFILNNLQVAEQVLIARVFYYKEKDNQIIMDIDEIKNKALKESINTRTLPYAWVLKAGSGCRIGDKIIKDGDIVRLYDYQARTVINPRHVAYYENEASESNAQIQGGVPDSVVHRLHIYHKERTVWINPTNEPDTKDFHTFIFGLPDVMGVFENKKILM